MTELVALPAGRFPTIVVDPPWHWGTWSERGRGRCADRHYAIMGLDDIKAMPVADLALQDSVLLLWVPCCLLEHGLAVAAAWGFRFKTVGFVWAKITRGDGLPCAGLGYWTRQGAELCLLATRGQPRRLHRDVRQVIIEPRREHSRKPDRIYGDIERLLPGPYIELFSRASPRPGWTLWGREVGKFEP
jgi:N6-adenosine-specific RNA methylase IME4